MWEKIETPRSATRRHAHRIKFYYKNFMMSEFEDDRMKSVGGVCKRRTHKMANFLYEIEKSPMHFFVCLGTIHMRTKVHAPMSM